MVWREPKNDQDDWYFCSTDLGPLGTATKVKSPSLSYPNVSSERSQCRTAMTFRCQFSQISSKLQHSLQKGKHPCLLRKELQLIKASLFQIIRGCWISLSWMILSLTWIFVKISQKYSLLTRNRFIIMIDNVRVTYYRKNIWRICLIFRKNFRPCVL